MSKQDILFYSSSRADFGKLSVLASAAATAGYGVQFALGDAHFRKPSETYREVRRKFGAPVQLQDPDIVFVHGDTQDTLEAVTRMHRDVRIAHVEGGENSGSVDDHIRHAITKLAHVHFCSNATAADCIRSQGEDPRFIFPIGSPETDILLRGQATAADAFVRYGLRGIKPDVIVHLHPCRGESASAWIDAIHYAVHHLDTMSWLLLAPNREEGWREIESAWAAVAHLPHVQLLPSMRIEHYAAMLRSGVTLVGNSSAVVRDAPTVGARSILLGDRQARRAPPGVVIPAPIDGRGLADAILNAPAPDGPCTYYGDGNSAVRFAAILESGVPFEAPLQKAFTWHAR